MMKTKAWSSNLKRPHQINFKKQNVVEVKNHLYSHKICRDNFHQLCQSRRKALLLHHVKDQIV
jgi:hypothetical protein